MRRTRNLRSRAPFRAVVGWSSAALLLALVGCSSADKDQAPCEDLDRADPSQATVFAFHAAANALRERVGKAEKAFYLLCNVMNEELGVDRTKTSTVEACAVLHERVRGSVEVGAEVAAALAGNCVTDLAGQADCEAECSLPGDCDPVAQCLDGEVVIGCDGACSGACDGRAQPAGSCTGACHGDCSAPTSPPTCTGTLDCAGKLECHAACRALAAASVDCANREMTVSVVGDPELQRVVEAHADEWSELAAVSQALAQPILSLGEDALSAIGSGNYITLADQTCFVDALGIAVVAVTSTHAVIQASASLDPSVELPSL